MKKRVRLNCTEHVEDDLEKMEKLTQGGHVRRMQQKRGTKKGLEGKPGRKK